MADKDLERLIKKLDKSYAKRDREMSRYRGERPQTNVEVQAQQLIEKLLAQSKQAGQARIAQRQFETATVGMTGVRVDLERIAQRVSAESGDTVVSAYSQQLVRVIKDLEAVDGITAKDFAAAANGIIDDTIAFVRSNPVISNKEKAAIEQVANELRQYAARRGQFNLKDKASTVTKSIVSRVKGSFIGQLTSSESFLARGLGQYLENREGRTGRLREIASIRESAAVGAADLSESAGDYTNAKGKTALEQAIFRIANPQDKTGFTGKGIENLIAVQKETLAEIRKLRLGEEERDEDAREDAQKAREAAEAASEAGQPLYSKSGVTPVPNMAMMLKALGAGGGAGVGVGGGGIGSILKDVAINAAMSYGLKKVGGRALTRIAGTGVGRAALRRVAGSSMGRSVLRRAMRSGGLKVAEKAGAKVAAKTVGKSLLKKIPGLGLVAGLGFGAKRALGGDFLGALGEVASGAASTVPGIGTAASVGIDALLAGRDMGAFGSAPAGGGMSTLANLGKTGMKYAKYSPLGLLAGLPILGAGQTLKNMLSPAETTPSGATRMSGMGDGTPESAIAQAASMTGMNPDQLAKIARIESGMNPNAQPGTSTAKGLFQFTDRTWNDVVKNYKDQYPMLANASPFDPNANALAGALFVRDNQKALGTTDLGMTYLAHFAGAEGAKSLMSANPQASAASVMGEKAAKANPAIFYDKGRERSVEEVRSLLTERVSRQAGLTPVQASGTQLAALQPASPVATRAAAPVSTGTMQLAAAQTATPAILMATMSRTAVAPPPTNPVVIPQPIRPRDPAIEPLSRV